MAKQFSLEKIQQEILSTTKVQQLFDICDELWNRYFLDKTLSKDELKQTRDVYNDAAKAANKHAGAERISLITPSLKWVPKEDAKGKPVARLTPAHAGTISERTATASRAKPTESIIKRLTSFPKPKKEPGAGGGIIDQILTLHKAGKTNKEIIAAGFNKSTVNRQVSEYKKRTSYGKA